MSLRRAILWSLFWVGAALCFALALSLWNPPGAQLFLAGYALEKSLSIDNLMVFAAIFAYFGIAPHEQPRILYLGILGVIVLRFIFVALGAGALMLAGPVAGAVFGSLVIWSAVGMLGMGKDGDSDVDYDAKWFVRLARAVSVTPAFVCLVAIEISDIIFSFDSMPAVISLVQAPIIVYAAVMFAVLGLRSLYFVLIVLMQYLVHLEKAVIALLFFIGTKMLLHSFAALADAPRLLRAVDLSAGANLIIVLGTLALGVIASLVFKPEPARVLVEGTPEEIP
jgi:tellurite resistance protein TerC